MSTSDASFLAAIHAATSDDLPRLVYADWLEENGKPDRAEFIRVQCELGRFNPAVVDLVEKRPGPIWQNTEFSDISRLRRRERESWRVLEPWDFARSFALPEWTLTTFANGFGFRVGPSEGHPRDVRCEVDRGFVAVIRCRLRSWCGSTRCECRGSGRESERMAGGLGLCRICDGAGYASGIGPAVVAAHPVELVVPTDREPVFLHNRHTGEQYCTWLREGEPQPAMIWHGPPRHDPTASARLPVAIWDDSLTERFSSVEEAKAALSARLIAWAKSQTLV